MFTLSLVLVVLGQTPLEVSSSTTWPPRSSSPAVAFTGSEYVVVWSDDRLNALRARGMSTLARTDLWRANVPTDGGAVQSEPVCVAKPNGRPAVSADPQTGAATVAWFEGPPGATQLRRALLRPGSGAGCLPGILPTGDGLSDLHATWAGNQTLLAWANQTTSNVVLCWLKPDGLPAAGPDAITSGSPGASSVSLGALTGAARVAWVDGSGAARLQDVRENQTTPISGSQRTLAIASGVALDQRGSVAVTQTGNLVVAQYLDGGSTPLNTALSAGRVWVVSAGARSLGVSDTGSSVTAWGFDRFGDTPLFSATTETGVAVATDGTDALLVTATTPSKALHTRHVPLSGTGLSALTREPLLLAPAVLRRPSVAWTGEVWLVSFQEQVGGLFGDLFEGRSVTVAPGDPTLSPVHALSAGEPVVLTRPSGSLLLRTDTASSTSTAQATWDGTLDTLVSGATVQTSPVAPAGAATDVRTAHWTATSLYTPSTMNGAPFQGGTAYRSFAATPGSLWIPLADGTALKTVQLTDTVLGGPLMQVPGPQRSHTGSFDRTVTPALAANWDAVDQRVLVAWVDGQGVQWEVIHTANSAVDQGLEPSTRPVFALAAAASGPHFLLAWTDATGLTVKGVRADGTTTGPWHFGAPGEQAGEPVAASSDAGEVAVVWPWYSPTRNTVGLRILVLDPFAAAPDAGVADAGTPDAGAPDAGGPTKDGGVDAGEPKDSGVTPEDAGALVDAGLPPPDGGVDPVSFETSGCACTAMAANGAWALLLLLALRRRRAPRG